MCSENNVSKDKYRQSTKEPYSFLYLDKQNKRMAKNFDEIT